MPPTDYSTTPTGSRAPEYGPTSKTETATEARGAVTGQGNGVVLVISTLGVVAAFAVIYALFFT